MIFSRLFPLVLLAVFVGCSRPPVITIKNQSSVTISNVVVSGSGFEKKIGQISANQDHRLKVEPQAESGVRLVFDAGPRHVDSGSQGYIEPKGGYKVTVEVDSDLNVIVSDDLKNY